MKRYQHIYNICFHFSSPVLFSQTGHFRREDRHRRHACWRSQEVDATPERVTEMVVIVVVGDRLKPQDAGSHALDGVHPPLASVSPYTKSLALVEWHLAKASLPGRQKIQRRRDLCENCVGVDGRPRIDTRVQHREKAVKIKRVDGWIRRKVASRSHLIARCSTDAKFGHIQSWWLCGLCVLK